MPEESNPTATPPAPEPQTSERQFAIHKIYAQDISFETPNSPRIFNEKWKPKLNVDLNSEAQPLENGLYRVVLRITVTASIGENTAYLAEVHQAGLFVIRQFPEQEMGALLGSYCPNILFPYAREAISTLVSRGGFPQMLLAPVNFDALYSQHIQKLRRQVAEAEAEKQEQTTH